MTNDKKFVISFNFLSAIFGRKSFIDIRSQNVIFQGGWMYFFILLDLFTKLNTL